VRLLKVGVDIERLAMGVATARMEVFTEFMSPVVVDIVEVFHTVNMIEDPEARRRAWAEKSDEIILAHAPTPARSLHDRS
jgi:hypothetical protein